MVHTRKTDSEINSGEVNFVEKPNENSTEMFEKMLKMMTEMEERLNKKMTDQHKKIDRKLTDYQGEIRKEMNEVKTRLDKIEKITDIQEIKTTLKTDNKKIKEHDRGYQPQQHHGGSQPIGVDVLIDMHEPRKQNVINWTEDNDLKPYVADVITVKAENQTNSTAQ